MPLRSLLVPAPDEERPAVRLGQQGRHEIAAPVEVMDEQQQLAEPGLAHVFAQKLRVTLTELGGGRLRRRGAAANDAPQLPGERLRRERPVEGRSEQLPPEAAAGPPAQACAQPHDDRPAGQHDQQQQQHYGDETRQIERQPAGIEQRSDKPGVAHGKPAAGIQSEQLQRESGRKQRQAADQHRQRRQQGAERQPQRERGQPQRPAPAIEPAGFPRRPAGRRRQTADRRASIAAKMAAAAPMPRPATMSILTPASCNAFSTPAW